MELAVRKSGVELSCVFRPSLHACHASAFTLLERFSIYTFVVIIVTLAAPA